MRKSNPAAKLFLVKPRQPEPPADLVEEALAWHAHTEVSQFAMELSGARTMFRKYRALVEAPDFPEFLHAHYVEEWEQEPGDECVEPDIDVLACLEANAITPEARAQLLPDARKTALDWLAKEQVG